MEKLQVSYQQIDTLAEGKQNLTVEFSKLNEELMYKDQISKEYTLKNIDFQSLLKQLELKSEDIHSFILTFD